MGTKKRVAEEIVLGVEFKKDYDEYVDKMKKTFGDGPNSPEYIDFKKRLKKETGFDIDAIIAQKERGE